jgi:hypothetical protein
MQFIIGADPEVFVGDKTGVRSIIGKIGGTKANPMPLPLGEGFAVQEDNVALEFNIPASKSKQEFVGNIREATAFLEKVVSDQYGFNFVKDSAVSFPDEELQDPAALEFGCEPDFNAWTLEVNPKPKAEDANLRSCGGHVHVGFKKMDIAKVIRTMDLYLGVPSVKMDKGELRKKLYGKAGAYRKKKYGGEYRTLSNFWIFESKLVEWVYDNTERALDAVKAGIDISNEKEAILDAINNNNHVAADYLINRYNLSVL